MSATPTTAPTTAPTSTPTTVVATRAASTVTVRELHRAQAQARAVAAELVDPDVREQPRDDGTVTRHIGPSLLAQLRAAVATGSESGRVVRSRAGLPMVLCAAALDLVHEIESETALWWPREHAAEARIRAVTAAAGRWTDMDLVARLVAQMRSWAAAIRAYLDPPRRLHIAAACPACDVRMVHRRDDTGAMVLVPVLQVDGDTGCVCLACRHHWPTTHLELLARALDCAPLPGA
jgi:hypothetical protein